MEFHEELQALRHLRGLTQEELAQQLFVSRTAVSKWESGRGYPGVDSLRAIAACFSVSLDALLSGEAVASLAEAERAQRAARLRARLLGALDCGTAVLPVLPLFAGRTGAAQTLLSLTPAAPCIKPLLLTAVLLQTLCGAAGLALQGRALAVWQKWGEPIAFGAGLLCCLLFSACRQPYAAAASLALLAGKVLLLRKRP